jgi:uncharacterized protein YneF (UPF0154 family)
MKSRSIEVVMAWLVFMLDTKNRTSELVCVLYLTPKAVDDLLFDDPRIDTSTVHRLRYFVMDTGRRPSSCRLYSLRQKLK